MASAQVTTHGRCEVNRRIRMACVVAVTGATAVAATVAFAGGSDKRMRASLTGYEEVPAVSTAASGAFQATLSPGRDRIDYKISDTGLEGDVTQSHIHVGQRGVNGGISVFLCSNLGNGPIGTKPCPPAPASVEGTLRATDVIGPAAQGVAAGEFDELLRAIRAGVAYANVHSTKWPGGEIRSQLRPGWPGGHGGGPDGGHGGGPDD